MSQPPSPDSKSTKEIKPSINMLALKKNQVIINKLAYKLFTKPSHPDQTIAREEIQTVLTGIEIPKLTPTKFSRVLDVLCVMMRMTDVDIQTVLKKNYKTLNPLLEPLKQILTTPHSINPYDLIGLTNQYKPIFSFILTNMTVLEDIENNKPAAFNKYQIRDYDRIAQKHAEFCNKEQFQNIHKFLKQAFQKSTIIKIDQCKRDSPFELISLAMWDACCIFDNMANGVVTTANLPQFNLQVIEYLGQFLPTTNQEVPEIANIVILLIENLLQEKIQSQVQLPKLTKFLNTVYDYDVEDHTTREENHAQNHKVTRGIKTLYASEAGKTQASQIKSLLRELENLRNPQNSDLGSPNEQDIKQGLEKINLEWRALRAEMEEYLEENRIQVFGGGSPQ